MLNSSKNLNVCYKLYSWLKNLFIVSFSIEILFLIFKNK